MLSQSFDEDPNRNIHHENKVSESSAYHRGKFSAMATNFLQQPGFPHHALFNYEHQGLVGLSSVMVQQQLANLQTSFQQQIAALGAALGASTNSASPLVLLMYLENSVTSFPTLIATSYLFGFLGNSIRETGGEKLNGQNYFSCLNLLR